MTLEKYVETTPKGYYLLIDRGYNAPGKRRIPIQELMENEQRWKIYRKHLVGAVDSIDPPDGYTHAQLLYIERGFDLWCKEST